MPLTYLRTRMRIKNIPVPGYLFKPKLFQRLTRRCIFNMAFLLIVLLFYFASLHESLRLCVKWLFVVYCESGRQILLLIRYYRPKPA